VINVCVVNSNLFEPTAESSGLYSHEIVSSAQFPRESNVEPERKQLIELVSGNILSADERAPTAIIVMGKFELPHSVLQ
jgi:hypothetical protein